MLKRAYLSLPGPTPVRILLAAVIVMVAIVVLGFVYDYLGRTYLDTGGTIG